ncbi:hypothetical protein [uncultured Gammaproteobacteria bacterium]|nr:hypothetical protein [uncultured Gammaproteobacteria bacterium]
MYFITSVVNLMCLFSLDAAHKQSCWLAYSDNLFLPVL